MDKAKQKRLAELGGRVTTVEEFLGLTPEEARYIELKVALANRLKELRQDRGMTQTAVAELIKSSQPRVVKMEKGDQSVSIDLIIKALFELGEDRDELAKTVSGRKLVPA